MVKITLIARWAAAVLLVLTSIGCAGPEVPDRALVARGEQDLLARLGQLEDNEQALPEAERLAVALLHVAPNSNEPQVQALNWLVVRARAAAGDVDAALMRFDSTLARRALSGRDAQIFASKIAGAGIGGAGAELSRALFLQQRNAEARRVASQTLARSCADRGCFTSKRLGWLLALTGEPAAARIYLDLAIGEAVMKALETDGIPGTVLSTELRWSRQTQRVLSAFGGTRDLDRTERATLLLLDGALRNRDPRYSRFVNAPQTTSQGRLATTWMLGSRETFIFLASAAPVEFVPLLSISSLVQMRGSWQDNLEQFRQMRRGVPLAEDIARIQDGQVWFMRTRAQREAERYWETMSGSPPAGGSIAGNGTAEHRLAILQEMEPERRALQISILDAMNR